MRHAISLTLLLAAGFGAGCNSSDDDGGATAFAPLVNDLILNQTTETGAPIETNGQTFVFPTDESAFAGVLPPDNGSVVD